MVKKLVFFIVFLIGFNTAEHFCHKQTDGFSISRIQFKRDKKIDSSIPQAPVLAILNQPFHFLDSGNQCFAFLSQDGQYVLKFFKYVDHAAPVWTTKVPLLNRLKPFRLKRQKKIGWKRKRDFHGYQLAYHHLKQETGLLWIHLLPSKKIYPEIQLFDKLNISHPLDLNKTPFILQRRATPIYAQFSQWIKAGEFGKVKQGISNLISLCALKLSKNIHDDDVHFYSNFGFIAETPIQLDPGHFIINPSENSREELQDLTIELKEWFSKHYPPLVAYVETCALSH